MTTSSASSATPQANSRTRLLGLGALAVALVLTVACAATAVFAVIADSRHRDSYKQDQALVALLKADFQMDRALYTELQAIISGLTTKVPADEGPLTAAATELGACAKDFGIDNLKLTDSEADQQVRLLFEDPAARVQGARDEIDRGTIDGTKLPATFATLRAAVYTFAEKAPSLFNSPSLAEISQDYAEGANPERTSPPRIDQEVDPLDVRVRTLDLLTKFSEAVDQSGPRALWLASAIAGALAAGAWALVFAQRKAWAIGASLKNLGQSVKPAAKPATKE
ncbi:MAG: hypothetical protein LBH68_01940, partial [Bifidobacteriaceae bacterium]|nr:hypothetical protein [Bifidobacteriaceae bacterium]